MKTLKYRVYKVGSYLITVDVSCGAINIKLDPFKENKLNQVEFLTKPDNFSRGTELIEVLEESVNILKEESLNNNR